MHDKYEIYKAKLLQSLVAQHCGDITTEDALLAELDVIWLSMTANQRAQTDWLTRYLSSVNSETESGELRAGALEIRAKD